MGKYFSALSEAGIAWSFIGWNKDGQRVPARSNFYYFSVRAMFGGRWKNVAALLRWNIYVFCCLVKERRNIKIVHAVDLDAGFASWLFCTLFRRPLVLDLYDKYTAVRSIDGVIGRFLDFLEGKIAKSAALTIIASAERYVQHGLKRDDPRVLVLENVPSFAMKRVLPWKANRPWNIGYFGVLEPHHRGLEDLLAVCEGRDDVFFHILGYGSLESKFSTAAAAYKNIRYYGAMDSEAGLGLMAGMDVIVGLYYRSVPNHHFASPNKYYEHLMLGRPLLTTVGTPPGSRVEHDASGWALREGQPALLKWLDELESDAVISRGARAAQVWDERYSSYYRLHYCGEYIECVKNLGANGQCS